MLTLVESDSTLVLSGKLLSQTLLRMLKLSGLRVVSFLPRQLPNEAISEPDKKHGGEVDVTQIDTIFEHVSAAEVSMHQRPRLVDALALDDFIHKLAQLLAQVQQLFVKIVHAWVLLANWHVL